MRQYLSGIAALQGESFDGHLRVGIREVGMGKSIRHRFAATKQSGIGETKAAPGTAVHMLLRIPNPESPLQKHQIIAMHDIFAVTVAEYGFDLARVTACDAADVQGRVLAHATCQTALTIAIA